MGLEQEVRMRQRNLEAEIDEVRARRAKPSAVWPRYGGGHGDDG